MGRISSRGVGYRVSFDIWWVIFGAKWGTFYQTCLLFHLQQRSEEQHVSAHQRAVKLWNAEPTWNYALDPTTVVTYECVVKWWQVCVKKEHAFLDTFDPWHELEIFLFKIRQAITISSAGVLTASCSFDSQLAGPFISHLNSILPPTIICLSTTSIDYIMNDSQQCHITHALYKWLQFIGLLRE